MLKNAVSGNPVEDFMACLAGHGKFGHEFVVYFTLTNAEGNMTHSEYLRLVEDAKEEFGASVLWGNFVSEVAMAGLLNPCRSEIHYKKDFFFGDKGGVSLRAAENEAGYCVLEADFINTDTGESHAVVRQFIPSLPKQREREKDRGRRSEIRGRQKTEGGWTTALVRTTAALGRETLQSCLSC